MTVETYNRQDWQTVQQSVHSEGTSLDQIPSLHKHIAGQLRGVNLDMGGGAYDKATQFLAQHGVKNLVYDPYNRPPQHNQQVMAAVAGGRADSVTIANVLNVIPEPAAQLQTLKEAADALKPGGTVYIDVYPGNGSGHPEKTSKGFQQNKPLQAYLPLVQQVFPQAKLTHSMIVAQNGGGQQQQAYARVSDAVDQYAKLGPAAGQKNLFTPQVTKSGAMKKRWQEELHPRTGKGVGNGGKFQSKHGGGQSVRVVDHGTHHIAHVQHPHTGEIHQYKGHDHAHAVRKAAVGSQNRGFTIENPKPQPEMGGLFAGAKKPQPAPPKPAGPQHTSPPPPKPKAQGGLFDNKQPQTPPPVAAKPPSAQPKPSNKPAAPPQHAGGGLFENPKEGDTKTEKGVEYVLRNARWHRTHEQQLKDKHTQSKQQAEQKAAHKQGMQKLVEKTHGTNESNEAMSEDEARKAIADLHAGIDKQKEPALKDEQPDWSDDQKEMRKAIIARATKRRENKEPGTPGFTGPPEPTYQQKKESERAAFNKAYNEGVEERRKEKQKKDEDELQAGFMKTPEKAEEPGRVRAVQYRDMKNFPVVPKPSKAEDWKHRSVGRNLRLFYAAQGNHTDENWQNYLQGRSEKDAYDEANSVDYTLREKALRSAIDFGDGELGKYIQGDDWQSHNVPPLPRPEERGYESAMNYIKPGQVVSFGHHDGTETIARLESKQGKKQSFVIVKPSETASGVHAGSRVKMHADDNFLFLGMVKPKDQPKGMPPVGTKGTRDWRAFEDGNYQPEGEGMFATGNVDATKAANRAGLGKPKEERKFAGHPRREHEHLRGAVDQDERKGIMISGIKRREAEVKVSRMVGDSAVPGVGETAHGKSEWNKLLNDTKDLPTATERGRKPAGRKMLKGQYVSIPKHDGSEVMGKVTRVTGNKFWVSTQGEHGLWAPTQEWPQDAGGILGMVNESEVSDDSLFGKKSVRQAAAAPPAEPKPIKLEGKQSKWEVPDSQKPDLPNQAPEKKATQSALFDAGKKEDLPGQEMLFDDPVDSDNSKTAESQARAAGKKDPHADALERGKKFTEYGPTYDRNIATSYGHYMNAKERGHSQQMLDGLHGELKMRLEAKAEREAKPKGMTDAESVKAMMPGAKKRQQAEQDAGVKGRERVAENNSWAENHIKIAADDISKLRKTDVHRVLDGAPDERRGHLESWIQKHRPDLSAEVNEVAHELDVENAARKDKEEAKAAKNKEMDDFVEKGKAAPKEVAGKYKHSDGDRVTINTPKDNNNDRHGQTGTIQGRSDSHLLDHVVKFDDGKTYEYHEDELQKAEGKTPKFTSVASGKDYTDQVNSTLQMQDLNKDDLGVLMDVIPGNQHDALIEHMQKTRPHMASVAQEIAQDRQREAAMVGYKKAVRDAHAKGGNIWNEIKAQTGQGTVDIMKQHGREARSEISDYHKELKEAAKPKPTPARAKAMAKQKQRQEMDEFVDGKKDKPLSMQLDEINDKNEPEGGWSDSDRVPMEQQKATKAAGGKSPHQGLLNRADWHKEDKGISAAAASLQEAIDEGYSPEMQKRMADQLSGKLERKNDGRMAEAVNRAGEEEKNKEQRPMPAATSDMTNDELRAAAAEAGKTKQPKEPKGAYDPERREQAPASESRQKEYEKQVAEYGESKKRASEIKDQLKHNDRVGRGEATAAVKATAASDTPSSDAVKKTDGHREAAQHYYDAQKHEDYAWARKSDVDNVGADLAGAARHVRNEWRTLEDLEAMGAAVAEKGITRSNLQKRKPNNFAVHAEKNPMTALAMHFAMNTIPQRPYGTKSNEAKGTSLDGMNADEFRASTRKQYVEMFDALHAKAEELAGGDMGPSEALHEFARFADSHRNKLTKGGYSQTVRTTYDALKKIHKQTRTAKNYKDKFSLDPSQDNYRFKSNTAIHKMREFAKLAQEHHGRFDGGDDVQQKAIDVISGSTVASVFGKKVAGGNKNAEKFNPSEAYVTGVSNRKGGRKVNTSSHGKTQKMLMGGLTIRGLQYGNSMTDDERVHHTAKSAEAFVDLADALGVPDEAIGMKGKLGLAFGARGRAGAKAHFESAGNVINMTRKNGSGSLAHEWAHFLDFNSGERMGTAASSQRNDNHKKLQTAWAAAKQRIGESVRERYEGFSAKVRQKEYEYWTSDVEMFARYSERLVQSNLHKEGRDNTYLVGLNKSGHSWWPSDAELEKARPHLEAIYSEFGKKWEGEHGKVERKERYERIRALRDGDSYQRADITAFIDQYFRDEWWVYVPEPSLSAAVDQYAQRTLGQLAVHGAADLAVSPFGKARAFNRMAKAAFGAWQGRNAGQQSPQHTALEKRHGLDAGQGHRMLQEHARRSARAELKGQTSPQQGQAPQQQQQAGGGYYEPPAAEWKGPAPDGHPDAPAPDPQKQLDFEGGPAATQSAPAPAPAAPAPAPSSGGYRAGSSPGLGATAAGVPISRREGGAWGEGSAGGRAPAQYRPGSIGDRLQQKRMGADAAGGSGYNLHDRIKDMVHKRAADHAQKNAPQKPAPAQPAGPALKGKAAHMAQQADALQQQSDANAASRGIRPDAGQGLSGGTRGAVPRDEPLPAGRVVNAEAPPREERQEIPLITEASIAAKRAGQAPGAPPAAAEGPSNKGFEELHPRGKEGQSDGGKFVKKGQEGAGSPTDQAPPPQLSPEQVHHIQQQKAAQAAAIEHKKAVEMEPLGVRVNGEKPAEAQNPYAGTALDLGGPAGMMASQSQEVDPQTSHNDFMAKQAKARAMRAHGEQQKATPGTRMYEDEQKRQASNYTGKAVSVGGQPAEVVGNAYGKTRVRYQDGTEKLHDPSEITAAPEQAPQDRSEQLKRELADRDARNAAKAEFNKLPKAAAAGETGLAQPNREDFRDADGVVDETAFREASAKWSSKERKFDNRRQDQHQDRIKAAATSAGVDPVELHQIAQQTHEMHMAQHKEWAPIVRQAQGLVSKSKAENIENSRDRAGAGDYSNVSGFDDMLDEMMSNNPHLDWGDNPSDTLWQKVKDGGRAPRLSDDHILRESVDYLTRQNSSSAANYGDPEGYEPPDHSGGYDPDDPDAVPFARQSDVTAILDRYMRAYCVAS